MDTVQPNVTGRASGVRGPSSIDPEELIDSITTAKLLRLQPQTLATWRAEKRGPPYVKIGRACYYVRSDIQRWLAAQVHYPSNAAAA